MRLWAICLFVLTACSWRDRPLQFNLGTEAIQLDWTRAIDTSSAVLLDNVMEGLTTYLGSLPGSQAELLRPLPALAASWSVSEGGRLYRFHLRPHVLWSDGVPLEAKQFVEAWERLLNPGTASANAYQLFEVEGAAAYASGRLRDFGGVGVKAVDPLLLEVRLRRPVPYFLHVVASSATFPIRKDLIERLGDQWTEPSHYVTLGPYRIAEWAQGERIVLEAYRGYHGERPKVSTVICRLISEPLTALAYYENGDLDILPRDLPVSFARALRSRPDYRAGPKLSVSYLLFNVHRAPFDTAERRRAFIAGLDREALASFFEGTQEPFSSWVPPGLLGYDPSLGVKAEGKGSAVLPERPVTLRFTGSDTWNLMFQSLQREVADRLNFKVKLEQVDGKELQKSLAAPGRHGENLPPLLLLGWVADYPDAISFLNVFTSTSENNYMGWRNGAYDALVEKGSATEDEAARQRYYLEAQRLLLEREVVLVPLFLNAHQALVSTHLRGVSLNVLDKWYFQNVEFLD